MHNIKELREACKQPEHGLEAFYNGGEIYINSKYGTVFNRSMDWETAKELCEELDLELTEI